MPPYSSFTLNNNSKKEYHSLQWVACVFCAQLLIIQGSSETEEGEFWNWTFPNVCFSIYPINSAQIKIKLNTH